MLAQHPIPALAASYCPLVPVPAMLRTRQDDANICLEVIDCCGGAPDELRFQRHPPPVPGGQRHHVLHTGLSTGGTGCHVGANMSEGQSMSRASTVLEGERGPSQNSERSSPGTHMPVSDSFHWGIGRIVFVAGHAIARAGRCVGQSLTPHPSRLQQPSTSLRQRSSGCQMSYHS